MPPLRQPKVEPLPPGIDLTNKTAIVTGATAGIGLELSRQLLNLNLSTLILAVRNISKGEEFRKTLSAINPKAVVQVMKLDTADYASVKAFAETFKSKHGKLHLLMLNAGISDITFELAPTEHEKNFQVNYLSNVLLTLLLLPTLEHTAELEGAPTRITWTGSRMHWQTSLANKVTLKKDEGIFEHFDTPGVVPPLTRYGDTKLLVLLFQHELADRYPPKKVIINHFCPGMVDTSLTDILPVYIRLPALMVKALRARSVDKAGWIGLHAALVVGDETHGQLLGDKEIADLGDFVPSEEGMRIRKMLWEETVEEMRGLTQVPSWME
ncbi:Short-chain dehydrogenase reductase SDR [Fusarium acutatum]|uniref:Short-chain dehydrogenase reductase SDR n=1 Tax=Fusarium acutatum TaxID=78861 RepID=A0A8H4K380_9HYPO|nr:Short-chain dehydrogenase reductase SDR [Fusarium acutatum]